MREALLFFHFLGLAMGLGTSFAFMFLGIARSKMDREKGNAFMVNALALGRMGHIGLFFLVVSGILLMTPHWKDLGASPLLIAKFVLVAVLIVLIGMISMRSIQAKTGDPEPHLKKIEPLGKASLLTALAIVLLAVLHFG